jgi:peroxiredoxin
MKNIAIGFGIILLISSVSWAADAKVGEPAPDFTLTDSDGTTHSLSDFKGKTVVLEWINYDCPFVRKHYDSGNMQSLQETYTEKGVVWLAICSSNEGKQGYFEGEALDKRIEKEGGNQTAYLLDTDGTVGKTYGAKTTPHMYVIDPDGMLIYMGGIDDKPSYKTSSLEGATNYVKAALEASMAGEEVEVKTSKPYGCSVKY